MGVSVSVSVRRAIRTPTFPNTQHFSSLHTWQTLQYPQPTLPSGKKIQGYLQPLTNLLFPTSDLLGRSSQYFLLYLFIVLYIYLRACISSSANCTVRYHRILYPLFFLNIAKRYSSTWSKLDWMIFSLAHGWLNYGNTLRSSSARNVCQLRTNWRDVLTILFLV